MSTAQESGSWSRAYNYDPYGNRWVTANHPLAFATPTAQSQFDAATNRVTKTVDGTALPGNAFDAAGNLTNHPWVGAMAYDAEKHQTSFTSASGTTTYQYDGDGRRVKKLQGSRTTVFVYDAFGNLAAEYDTQPDPHLAAGTYYRTTDHLGSTRLVTNGTGAVVSRRDFFPFGEEIPANATFGNRNAVTDGGPATTYNQEFGVHQKFTGKESDAETGLDCFGAQYMSSALGRFSSPDAKQSSAKLDNPQSWNRYSYTDNNPLAFVDPDGKEKLRVTLTTYIPGRTVTDPFGRIYTANGNGRGSTPLDYKTKQTAIVETDRRISPSGKIGEPTGVVGVTQRFDKNGKEIDRAKEPGSAVKQSAGRQQDGSVGISFSGAATNPLGLQGTPAIDFSISITCTGGSCSATGAHDGFPAYRIEVANEAGKTTEIYTYDPNKAGKTPTALFPPMDCQVPRSDGCAAGQGQKQ